MGATAMALNAYGNHKATPGNTAYPTQCIRAHPNKCSVISSGSYHALATLIFGWWPENVMVTLYVPASCLKLEPSKTGLARRPP